VKRAVIVSARVVVAGVLVAAGCSSGGPVLPTDDGPTTGGSAGKSGTGGATSAGAAGHAGVANAGNGAGGTGATTPGTFNDVAAIMARNCGASQCHGGGPGGQPLVYTNKATLYNTLTTTVVTECMSAKLVTPGDPTHSALVLLPTWMCKDQSGGPFVMPQGCITQPDPCLTDAEMASIKQWIMAGAPAQ